MLSGNVSTAEAVLGIFLSSVFVALLAPLDYRAALGVLLFVAGVIVGLKVSQGLQGRLGEPGPEVLTVVEELGGSLSPQRAAPAVGAHAPSRRRIFVAEDGVLREVRVVSPVPFQGFGEADRGLL